MPLYRNTRTGKEKVADDDYVSAFPAGTWEKLADESPGEIEKRKLREQEEAIRNKVELEDAIPAVQEQAPAQGEPSLELGVIHHDNQEG